MIEGKSLARKSLGGAPSVLLVDIIEKCRNQYDCIPYYGTQTRNCCCAPSESQINFITSAFRLRSFVFVFNLIEEKANNRSRNNKEKLSCMRTNSNTPPSNYTVIYSYIQLYIVIYSCMRTTNNTPFQLYRVIEQNTMATPSKSFPTCLMPCYL